MRGVGVIVKGERALYLLFSRLLTYVVVCGEICILPSSKGRGTILCSCTNTVVRLDQGWKRRGILGNESQYSLKC